MRHFSKKISAAILSAVFFLTSGPLSYSFEINQYLHARPEAPVSQRIIYFIHDIHGQKEAQLSIGTLIKDLQSKAKVGFVGLEGLEGPVTLDGLRNYPQHQILKSVADFFLEKNGISGPIHEALLSKEPLPPIYGIEDSAAYLAHVRAYKSAEPLMKELKRDLHALQRDLTKKEAAVFNANLQRFHKMVRDYSEGGPSLLSYIEGLSSLPISIPEKIRLYSKVLSLEKNLGMTKVQSEKTKFIAVLTRTLSPSEQQSLLKTSQNLREGRVSNTEFFKNLSTLARQKKIDLAGYPNLARYFEYVELMGRIDAQKLPDDIAAFEKSGYATLIKTNEEEKLVERERYIGLALKLVNFTMTPADWLEYQNLKSRQSVGEKNFLLAYFENFYHLAHRRDNTLATNILRTLNATKADAGVVVIGGFHFQGVRQILEAKNIRIVSVLPSVSAELLTSESPTYLKALSSNRSLLERVLSGAVWTLSLRPNAQMTDVPGALMAATRLLPGGEIPNKDALSRAMGLPTDARVITSRPTNGVGQAEVEIPGEGRVTYRVEQVSGNASDDSLQIKASRSWKPFSNVLDALRATVASVQFLSNRVLRGFVQVGVFSKDLWSSWRPTMLAVPLAIFLALPGCVTPDQMSHQIPTITPAEWVSKNGVTGDFQDGWSKYFPDKQLDEFIKAALAKNYALSAFDTRDFAKNLAEQAGYARWPKGDASVGADAANGFDGINNFGGTAQMQRTAVANLSWDADIFGRLSAAQKAAVIAVDVSKHQYDSESQKLVALVTLAYYGIAEFDAYEKIQVAHIARLRELVSVLEKKKNAPRVGIASTKSALSKAESDLIALQQAKREKIMGLQALTSVYPSGSIEGFVVPQLPNVPDITTIPMGHPLDLLDRVPSIRAAKATADMMYQNVRVAAADRWPLLSFGAGVSLQKIFATAGFDKLYRNGRQDPPSQAFWGVGGMLQGFLDPFIMWGVRKLAQDYAQLDEGTAISLLHQATLEGLKELEVGMSRMRSGRDQMPKLQDALTQKRIAIEGQYDLVQTGDDSWQQLLLEQVGLRVAELDIVNNKVFQLTSFVEVMTAAGGNWEAKPVEVKEGQAPPSTVAPTPAPENKGGSILTNPYYVAHLAKWETPFFYVIIAPIVAVSIAYFSTGVAAFTNAGILWSLILTPILFMVAHRERMFTPDVVRLTTLKMLVSLAGVALITAQVPSEVNLPILGALIAALTYYHGQIQNRVVAQLRQSMDVFAPVYQGDSTDVISIQVAMQESAATQRAATLRAASMPSDVNRNLLVTSLIDSGASSAEIGAIVKGAFADGNKKVLRRFITNAPDTVDAVNKEIARYNPDVKVEVNPRLFDVNASGISQLSLSLLEAYQRSQGLLDNTPQVRIIARSGLALTDQSNLITSSYREALIFSLTKNMALVPFTMGNLQTIIDAAVVAARAA